MLKLKKNLLRGVTVDQWISVFIKRFKKRNIIALQALQFENYIITDVRFGRIFRAYVQNIMKHAKTIEFTFSYNQMLIAWNNLNMKFRVHIFESTIMTSLNFFFDALNLKIIIWQKMTVKRFDFYNVNNLNMTSRNR